MAFAFVQDLPSDWETYEKIVTELGVETSPPAGLIVHTAGRTADGIRVIDVWESEEAHAAFANDRLGRARDKVLGADGPAAPAPETLTVEHLVRP